ncbi:MAG: DUF1775 domain-containing protein [Acidobacteriota bacterium]
MIHQLLVVLTAMLLLPTLAAAHVSVRPRESQPGAEERYTVRVPTEGAVSTTSVELQIPVGVTVVDVPPAAGASVEVRRASGHVTAIIWTREIKPNEAAEFVFVARNPSNRAEIPWKAYQRFADGSSADWIGPSGDRRPASITRLGETPGGSAQTRPTGEAAAIESWLAGYDAAFLAKDLDRLATYYHPDVTIYEGGGINNGWADYRDRHLGPELKAFQDLAFGHSERKVYVSPDGQSAYATARYFIKARMGERQLDSVGLETLLLIKGSDGQWKIRHSHTSSRARRPTDGEL